MGVERWKQNFHSNSANQSVEQPKLLGWSSCFCGRVWGANDFHAFVDDRKVEQCSAPWAYSPVWVRPHPRRFQPYRADALADLEPQEEHKEPQIINLPYRIWVQ